MKISELQLPFKVETNTDAIAIVSNEFQRNAYIERYGNVVVVPDGKVYRVREFAQQIFEYSVMKSRDCAIHGCE